MATQRLTWIKDREFHEAYNDTDDERLGYLIYERVGTFMHYCWYQESGVRMSPGCLQEVRDKQKELLNNKKYKIHKDIMSPGKEK